MFGNAGLVDRPAPGWTAAVAPQPEYAPVKVERSLLRDIKTLAHFHGLDANVWLSDLLRPIVAAKMVEMAREIDRRSGEVRQAKRNKH